MHQLEIVSADLAEILDAVREAKGAIAQAAAVIENGLAKVIDAGRKLRAKRELTDHGEWMEWLEVNVLEPMEITYETARKWIKLSEFKDTKGAHLDDATSVRQAYLLAGLLPEAESSSGGGGKDTGNYLVHITRLERAIKGQIAARPIKQWSKQDRVLLKQRLQPLVELFEELDAA